MYVQLLERVGLALEAARLPYMVIGGQAVLLYGEPRLTRDIDVTIGADLDRLHDLLRVAHELSLTPLVDPETFTRQTLVLPCEDRGSGIRVDFILAFSPYELQALDRVKIVPFGQAEIRFASAEDVIVQKVVAGRPRDLDDVKGILSKQPGCDTAYVRRWLGEFSSALQEPFLARFEETLRGAG